MRVDSHVSFCAESHQILRDDRSRRLANGDPVEKERYQRNQERNSHLQYALRAEHNAVARARKTLRTHREDIVQALDAVNGDVDTFVALESSTEMLTKQMELKSDLCAKAAILKAKRGLVKADSTLGSMEKLLVRSKWPGRPPLPDGWDARQYQYGRFGKPFWEFSHPKHGEGLQEPILDDFAPPLTPPVESHMVDAQQPTIPLLRPPCRPVEFRIARDHCAYNQTEFTSWEQANDLPIGSEWYVPVEFRIARDGCAYNQTEFTLWERANNLPIGSEWNVAPQSIT